MCLSIYNLLNLSSYKKKEVINKLGKSGHILFKNIPTMTEELGLDKIPDYETRVKMRYELIQKFPETVFWDFLELQAYRESKHFLLVNSIISTTGIIVTLTKDGRIWLNETRENNKYSTFKNGSIKAGVHRAVASTFIPRSEKIKNIPYHRLQPNHKDHVKSNNVVHNLEWVTPSRNKLHSLKNENYLTKECFHFKVMIDNGFRGREFIMDSDQIADYGWKTTEIRKFTNHKRNGRYFLGMVVHKSDSQESALGLPADIKDYFDTNKMFFNSKIKPIKGIVNSGPYRGFEFSLLGGSPYFAKRGILKVINHCTLTYKNCKFKHCTLREAIPLINKMSDTIYKTLIS